MSSPFFQNLLAIYTTTQLTPNTTATFNCAANFTVVGELSAVCSSTGQWVASDGTVVPTTIGGVPNPSCMAVPAAVSNLLAIAAAVIMRDVLVCNDGKWVRGHFSKKTQNVSFCSFFVLFCLTF